METQKDRMVNPDSDGKFYELNDMAKVNCQDCKGCSKCCQGMGDSIVLDPYDIYQFQKYGSTSAEILLKEEKIALGVADHMVLPHINMHELLDQCPFLNKDGRCSIHDYRPGICRLFPLGRDFQNGTFSYILLHQLCEKKNRTKEKISRWIGVEPAGKYHAFVRLWHEFRKEMAALLQHSEEEEAKILNLYLVRTFFLQPYDLERDFYTQLQEKVEKYRTLFLQEQ